MIKRKSAYLCGVEREKIINGLAQLGKLMCSLGCNETWSGFESGVTQDEYDRLQDLILRQKSFNGWFTEESVRSSLLALGNELTTDKLTEWTQKYSYSINPRRVAVIMAGNIPLVGFHDFISVLLSGNIIVAKPSSEDKTLLPAFAEILISFVPELKDRIIITVGKVGEVDAVIATGSDNSLKYFEQYFGKYPHIFRKNRTSLAVIDGTETEEELIDLGKDIFMYYGLGCRNVTHLMIKRGFDLDRFFSAMVSYGEIINHHKYANNYDYNKAVFLLNKIDLLDNNFVLLREAEELFSPLAMLNYHYYDDEKEVDDYLKAHEEELQVVVGHRFMPFGDAQCPMLDDYADNVDTLAWLETI